MQEAQEQIARTAAASRVMATLTAERSERLLCRFADEIERNIDQIVRANAIDLGHMAPSDYRYDRLKLTPDRLRGIAADTRKVATLPCPVGEELERRTMPNGLDISRVRVPLGVVGVIYEARPNVTVDVSAIALRSGNAVVLKGGRDAHESNHALVQLMRVVLTQEGLPSDLIGLLPDDHEAADDLMNAVGQVDLLIPRGSARLIAAVRDGAKVPVIETGAGVVHTYFHTSGDVLKGAAVICNAKTRRVSVCNALDCLLIDRARLCDLPELLHPMADKKVELHVDAEARSALEGRYPAELLAAITPEDYDQEYLSLKLAVVTVADLDAALEFIHCHGSRHSEAIVAEDVAVSERFLREVDAACVYVNASTGFTDGGQFGLGAEIGISTQKMHARGPMGLRELTSYKWLIRGNGQTRPA